MKFCPKCGSKIDDDNLNFCPDCGAPLPKDNIEEHDKPSKQSKKSSIKFVLISLVLMLVCVGIYFIYNKYQENKQDEERITQEQGKQETNNGKKDNQYEKMAEIMLKCNLNENDSDMIKKAIDDEHDLSCSYFQSIKAYTKDNVSRLDGTTYPTNYATSAIFTDVITYDGLDKIDLKIYSDERYPILYGEDTYWEEYSTGNLTEEKIIAEINNMASQNPNIEESSNNVDVYPDTTPLPGTYFIDDKHELIGADGVVGGYGIETYWRLFVMQGRDPRGGKFQVKGGKFTKEQLQAMDIPSEWFPYWAK